MLQEQKKEKPPVSISSIKTDTWLEVQSTAKLSFGVVEDLPLSVPKDSVATSGWDDRNERAQSDRCDYWINLPCCAAISGLRHSHFLPILAMLEPAPLRHLPCMHRYIRHLRQSISLASRKLG